MLFEFVVFVDVFVVLGEGVLGVEGEELAVVLVADIGWRKLRDNMDNYRMFVLCGTDCCFLFFIFFVCCFKQIEEVCRFVCVFGEIMT